MADFIPITREEKYRWIETFHTSFVANAAGLGFGPADIAALNALWTPFDGSHQDLQPKENAWRAALAAFRDDEAALLVKIRRLAASIQSNPAVSDELRSVMGLTIRKTRRSPNPVPVTTPVGEIDNSQRLQHRLRFRDAGAANKRKPHGVRGCEIWCVIGPEPLGPAQARYLGTATRSPFIAAFNPADAGKTAHHYLRWVNTRNQPGPWSATHAATISG